MFEGCALGQLQCLICLAGAVFLRGAAEATAFDLPKVLHGEVHRVFVSSFVFADMGQTCYGLILLWAVRHFERLMGIRKFGAFWTIMYIGSIVLNLVCTSLANLSLGLDFTPSSGPYFLIYSLLVLYHAHIPRVHASKYTLLNVVVFSEKTFVYLLALHLALCMGLQSLVPALSGLALGLLYLKTPLQTWRLPAPADGALGMFGAFYQRLTPAPAARRGGGGGGRGARGAAAAAAPPPEDAIATLVASLGVDREAAIRALQQSDNNLERAANILLR
jgi:hypothetical protein